MDYIIHILILIGIYSILALSLNLIVGFTGLVSIAQAAFFGIGAYTTAILLTLFGVNFFLSVIIGVIIAGIVGLAIGSLLSKLSNDYFTLASFGFNIIVFRIFYNWQTLTKGAIGIPGIIPRPYLFGIDFSNNLYFLILVLFFVILIYFLSEFLVKSSFGRVLKSIREDEKVVQIFGYNITYFKLSIFTIGAMIASISGSFFASYISYVDPSPFALSESIFILTIIIFGGLANNKGVILGTVCLILLPELLRFIGFPSEIAAQARLAIYGLILVLLMLYRPKGLLGEYKL